MALWSNIKMNGETNEMRELAARICRDYLNGAWKSVTAQNIGFKHISGGLSNLLYHISLPESLIKEKNEGEPNEVLIRVYGQTHGEKALEALITDSVIFTLLSERGLGPKLHGIFPGGRIEQYMNARPLLTRELADPKLSELISKKMALIHSMEVPLHKEPGWLWDTIENWLKTCDKKFNKANSRIPDFAKDMVDTNFREEARWLKERLESENSPVVFCHNDMQEGNILMCQDVVADNNNAEPKIILIDFEYCSYNYRAFDFANHFLEWTYDYTYKESPFFQELAENYPSEQQMLQFIKTYLNESGCKDNPRKILHEVRVFSLASHFFWTLWSIVNADTSNIPFGYWEYSLVRFNNYMKLKQEINQQTLPVKRKVAELD